VIMGKRSKITMEGLRDDLFRLMQLREAGEIDTSTFKDLAYAHQVMQTYIKIGDERKYLDTLERAQDIMEASGLRVVK
jgi:hypothetical protein